MKQKKIIIFIISSISKKVLFDIPFEWQHALISLLSLASLCPFQCEATLPPLFCTIKYAQVCHCYLSKVTSGQINCQVCPCQTFKQSLDV